MGLWISFGGITRSRGYEPRCPLGLGTQRSVRSTRTPSAVASHTHLLFTFHLVSRFYLASIHLPFTFYSMNAVLYARVSTEKQADKDLSIPAQLQAMRDYARQRNWVVAEEFVEPGVSARTAVRPALQAMLAKCKAADNRPDVVLVHKVDRLARNVYDHATIRVLLQQQHITLASVVENMDDSVSGQLVENIMASIAQFYSGNLSEEVKKGMRQKVLKGGWPHLPPRGYIQVRGDGDRGARVEIHPKVGPLIRAAFERYATHWYSLKGLAAAISREGISASNGRALAPAQVHRMLTNPFYMGRVQWKDLDVPGSHEPLVTGVLFERVQAALRHRFREPGAKGSVKGFPLRGLAICATCRGHMTAGWHKKRFGYYRCARRGYNKGLCAAKSYCPAKQAGAQVERLCGQLQISEKTVGAIRQAANALIDNRGVSDQRQVHALRIQRATLASREMRLTESFVAGEVSASAYKDAGTKIRTDLQRVDAELSRLEQSPSAILQRVEELLARATSIKELHDELNETRQVELLRSVIRTVVLDKGGVVGFTLRPPFDAIFKEGRSSVADRPASIHDAAARRVAEDLIDSLTLEPAA